MLLLAQAAGVAASAPTQPRVRPGLIGTIAFFLTVVDLFAAQAILPKLAASYAVSPAAMGLAVNASTLGMALAGLATAFLGRRTDQRRGIVVSLALLAIPTSLLAIAPDLASFAALRGAQGAFMAVAFTLTLAYLGEHCGIATSAAFAAYVTGNVASNLLGRLVAAAVAEHLGLGASFLALSALNLAGAALVSVTLTHTMSAPPALSSRSPLAIVAEHWRKPDLRATFGIGFCVLFAFIGTFTYVNFVLVRAPLDLDQMSLGLVYLVFLPSILSTPLAGRAVARFGTRPSLRAGLAVAALGLPLLLAHSLALVLAGLCLVGAGTFFAQAVATGFIGRAATSERAAASGMYLAAYFAGGLFGSAALGVLFDRLGWAACLAGLGASLAVAALLSRRIEAAA
jgi:predicted MFS family arabinose efflux permease